MIFLNAPQQPISTLNSNFNDQISLMNTNQMSITAQQQIQQTPQILSSVPQTLFQASSLPSQQLNVVQPLLLNSQPPSLQLFSSSNQQNIFNQPPSANRQPTGRKEVFKLIIPEIFKESFDREGETKWKLPNTDITDYFNYGFCDVTFRAFANKVRTWRGKFPVGEGYQENQFHLDKLNDRIPLDYGGCSNPFDDGLLETPQDFNPFNREQFIQVALEHQIDSFIFMKTSQKADIMDYVQKRNVLSKYIQKHDEQMQEAKQSEQLMRFGGNSLAQYSISKNYEEYLKKRKPNIDFIALQQQIMHNISVKNDIIHSTDSARKIYFLQDSFQQTGKNLPKKEEPPKNPPTDAIPPRPQLMGGSMFGNLGMMTLQNTLFQQMQYQYMVQMQKSQSNINGNYFSSFPTSNLLGGTSMINANGNNNNNNMSNMMYNNSGMQNNNAIASQNSNRNTQNNSQFGQQILSQSSYLNKNRNYPENNSKNDDLPRKKGNNNAPNKSQSSSRNQERERSRESSYSKSTQERERKGKDKQSYSSSSSSERKRRKRDNEEDRKKKGQNKKEIKRTEERKKDDYERRDKSRERKQKEYKREKDERVQQKDYKREKSKQNYQDDNDKHQGQPQKNKYLKNEREEIKDYKEDKNKFFSGKNQYSSTSSSFPKRDNKDIKYDKQRNDYKSKYDKDYEYRDSNKQSDYQDNTYSSNNNNSSKYESRQKFDLKIQRDLKRDNNNNSYSDKNYPSDQGDTNYKKDKSYQEYNKDSKFSTSYNNNFSNSSNNPPVTKKIIKKDGFSKEDDKPQKNNEVVRHSNFTVVIKNQDGNSSNNNNSNKPSLTKKDSRNFSAKEREEVKTITLPEKVPKQVIILNRNKERSSSKNRERERSSTTKSTVVIKKPQKRKDSLSSDSSLSASPNH